MTEIIRPVIRHLLADCDDDRGERIVSLALQEGVPLGFGLLRRSPSEARYEVARAVAMVWVNESPATAADRLVKEQLRLCRPSEAEALHRNVTQELDEFDF